MRFALLLVGDFNYFGSCCCFWSRGAIIFDNFFILFFFGLTGDGDTFAFRIIEKKTHSNCLPSKTILCEFFGLFFARLLVRTYHFNVTNRHNTSNKQIDSDYGGTICMLDFNSCTHIYTLLLHVYIGFCIFI